MSVYLLKNNSWTEQTDIAINGPTGRPTKFTWQQYGWVNEVKLKHNNITQTIWTAPYIGTLKAEVAGYDSTDGKLKWKIQKTTPHNIGYYQGNTLIYPFGNTVTAQIAKGPLNTNSKNQILTNSSTGIFETDFEDNLFPYTVNGIDQTTTFQEPLIFVDFYNIRTSGASTYPVAYLYIYNNTDYKIYIYGMGLIRPCQNGSEDFEKRVTTDDFTGSNRIIINAKSREEIALGYGVVPVSEGYNCGYIFYNILVYPVDENNNTVPAYATARYTNYTTNANKMWMTGWTVDCTVTASCGTGVNSVFFNTNPFATSSDGVASYKPGRTVYAFVELDPSYEAQSNWKWISGRIYRVGSYLVRGYTSYNFGTINANTTLTRAISVKSDSSSQAVFQIRWPDSAGSSLLTTSGNSTLPTQNNTTLELIQVGGSSSIVPYWAGTASQVINIPAGNTDLFLYYNNTLNYFVPPQIDNVSVNSKTFTLPIINYNNTGVGCTITGTVKRKYGSEEVTINETIGIPANQKYLYGITVPVEGTYDFNLVITFNFINKTASNTFTRTIST